MDKIKLEEKIPPRVLTIAGSDSGGGAGIQADLKTFQAFGVHGASAITAVTAQDTRRVWASYPLPPEAVAAQIQAVMEDLRPAAVKTGMLANEEIVRVVAGQLRKQRVKRLVVDPVMVATSGDRLLEDGAVAAVREILLPLALIVTPNLDEASILAGIPVGDWRSMCRAAEKIAVWGPRYVVIKGGHRCRDADDLLFDGNSVVRLSSSRRPGVRLHGTGCAFSAAIAAALALGDDPAAATRRAKDFIKELIRNAFPPGHGSYTLKW